MRVYKQFLDGVLVRHEIEGIDQIDPANAPAPRVKKRSLPYDEWPVWAKALKLMAKPEDKGIGDIVARLIGDENSEKFKAWYRATFNKDCGCKGRQDRWNRLYPLK